MMTIDEEYIAKHPRSRALYEAARSCIPSGITHDQRFLFPFPIYVERAAGSRKWDVDGNEYVDYWMGHGALLLGHSHPAIVAAITEQIPRMTHPGACTELEVTWAQLVQKLIPSAERVRFTMSGTEATLLALRVARAYTGRSKVLRFRGHFHGWHDYMMVGYLPPYDLPASAGVPSALNGTMLQAECNNLEQVEQILKSDPDVAAVILEPAGGRNGAVPTKPGFLQGLRELTRQRGVVLIFDEVISGFRHAPGGAQQRYGVTPDLTTLGKIVAGGLPGGALVGKGEVMAALELREDDPEWNRRRHVLHQGTYNANPLSAVAGITLLRLVADGQAQARAEEITRMLVQGMNEVIQKHGLPGCAYYGASVWHILPQVACPYRDDCNRIDCRMDPETLLQGMGKLAGPFRRSMFNYGVDTRPSGWVSAVHTEEDVALTIRAVDATLGRMKAEGMLPGR